MSKHGTAFSLGQYNEVLAGLIRALPRALDNTEPKELIAAISKNGELLEKVLAEAIQKILSAQPSFFAHDKTKYGLKLVEDVDIPVIPISNLELISFIEKEDGPISGETIRQRAKEMNANLGLRQAEYMLEHQADIPGEWKDHCLFFPGTLLCGGRIGGFSVPYLGWDGVRWILDFSWLGNDWCSGERLVRLCK